MEKLRMTSMNIIDENIEYIGKRFPNVLKETIDKNGEVIKEIDFDILKQELSRIVIDDKQERYQITWPEKKKSILLANSRINLTLRPKVDKSINFYNTQNLYIEGDNLDVLKLIREDYLKKVKLIYIDPPYNTGNNLVYKNDFSLEEDEYLSISSQYDNDGNRLFVNTETNGRFHTDWMNMIYPRLKVAKDLLTDDGFIVIAIDHNELANLLKICDEIFGEKNRVGLVTVVHKPEGRNQEKFFGTSNEFSLFYAKNKEITDFYNVVLDKEIADKYKLHDDKGNYRLQNFIRLTDGKLAYRNVRPNFWYPIYVNVAKNQISTLIDKVDEPRMEVYPKTKADVEMSWKLLPKSAEELIKKGEIEINIDKDGFISLMEKIRETQVIKTHWVRKEYNAIQYGTKIVNDLLGVKAFDFPKSIYLIEDILKLCTANNDIILDFFSGSGTTAHSTMLINSEDGGNRRFVMVQLPETIDDNSDAFKAGYKNICDIAEDRIRRAGLQIVDDYNKKKEFEGLFASNDVKSNLDIGFRVLRLDSSNMNDVYYNANSTSQSLFDDTVDNVKSDRTPLDLLFQVMLELGIELSAKIEEKEVLGKKYFIVNENDIVACFDNNVSNDVIKELAKIKPVYAVFRDSVFENDAANINCEQLFKSISPSTTIKVL